MRAPAAAAVEDPLTALARSARRLGVDTLSGPALLRASRGLRVVEIPGGNRVDLLDVGTTADGPVVAMAAEPDSLDRLAALLELRPEMRRRIRLVDPAALASAKALVRRIEARRAAPPVCLTPSTDAVDRVLALLSHRAGPLDARRTFDAAQASSIAIGLAALVGALAHVPEALFAGLAVAASALFVGFAALRLAASGFAAAPPDEPPRRRLAEAELPRYTVLVPLLNEARIVPRLVAGLKALRYPQDRLDVKLLVEAHDLDTRAALAHHAAGTAYEVIVVPHTGPRTKPKALDVGLLVARGDIVTIFDAEDRPDPEQLRTVAEVFAAAPASLGCVQARLAVDHAGDTWITRMFALEYAMLFDRLLPRLAAWNMPFLLGGTSNHFRRPALFAVGAWDAWNVTEDADLAVRLARRGFASTVVSSTTYEEAPLTLAAWFGQRTRWYKGWLQTWLVHARDPAGLLRGAGPAAFLVLQLQLLGTFVTVAAHPVFCLFLVGYASGLVAIGGDGSFLGDVAFASALVSLLLGYGAAVGLAVVAVRDRALGFGWPLLATLPFYWLLLAGALAAAVADLARRPHHWQKTEHGLARRPRR